MSELPYVTICVSGDDAFEFLQAQLTSDMTRLADHDRLLSAWCNPKGRVICLFRVQATDEGYLLSVPEGLADKSVQRLTTFRFRAKVEFETRPATRQELGIEGDVDAWMLQNLLDGIPEVWSGQSEEHTAHMLNLDLLDAVSIEKGCYPGQEIISRTHFRGATKRRLQRFESSAAIKAGDPVYDGERKVGDIVNAIGKDLLAIVPIDKAHESLTSGDAELTLVPLPYLP